MILLGLLIRNLYFLALFDLSSIIPREIKIEGFMAHRWQDRYMEGVEHNLKWIREGKLKYRETVTEEFQNLFRAFVEMLQGKNFGKAIVKV